LVLAFAGGKRTIGAAGIEEAWADLQQLPLPATRGNLEHPAPVHDIVEFGALNDDEEDPQTMAMPAHLLRPAASTQHTTTASNLGRIEAHLGRIELEYRSNPARQPGVRFAFHEPRTTGVDTFEQEELLVDQYAKFDASSSGAKRTGTLWPALTSQLPAIAEAAPSEPSAVSRVTALPDTDEDMIVVEDEIETLPINTARPPIRRREYGQLFAKLRRG
jgi:hypothetical protein